MKKFYCGPTVTKTCVTNIFDGLKRDMDNIDYIYRISISMNASNRKHGQFINTVILFIHCEGLFKVNILKFTSVLDDKSTIPKEKIGMVAGKHNLQQRWI